VRPCGRIPGIRRKSAKRETSDRRATPTHDPTHYGLAGGASRQNRTCEDRHSQYDHPRLPRRKRPRLVSQGASTMYAGCRRFPSYPQTRPTRRLRQRRTSTGAGTSVHSRQFALLGRGGASQPRHGVDGLGDHARRRGAQRPKSTIETRGATTIRQCGRTRTAATPDRSLNQIRVATARARAAGNVLT
jgi:hypothetical protein